MPLRLFHHHYPSIRVGFITILDSTQLVIQLFADGSRFAVFRNDVGFMVLQIVDALNGADNGCRSASSCFFESRQFFFRNGTAFNFHAHVFCQLHQAAVGNRRKDGSRQRGNVRVILDTEEVGAPHSSMYFFSFASR